MRKHPSDANFGGNNDYDLVEEILEYFSRSSEEREVFLKRLGQEWADHPILVGASQDDNTVFLDLPRYSGRPGALGDQIVFQHDPKHRKTSVSLILGHRWDNKEVTDLVYEILRYTTNDSLKYSPRFSARLEPYTNSSELKALVSKDPYPNTALLEHLEVPCSS